MKKRILSLLIVALMIVALVPTTVFAAVTSLGSVKFTVGGNPAAGLNGDVSITFTKSNNAYSGTLFLPGSADTDELTLSWDEGITVKVGNTSYKSGEAPVPANGASTTYSVKVGSNTANFTVNTMQGSEDVEGLFLNIDESMGTIAAMNGDKEHETACFGTATFDGETNYMSMKGRGNTTWSDFDKKPYNITFFKTSDYEGDKKKVELIDGTKTKKWSILTNSKDPTCLRNKIGYDIADVLGIGLPSESIDVWMNGEYLGNYLLTPKNDYQAPDDGYMVEIDNLSDVDQFTLQSSPKFTVKEMAKGLTVNDVKNSVSKAWDALRQSNSDAYLDYIDLDSWAKMYLLNELYKDVDVSAGSIFFTKATMEADSKLVAGPIWDLDGTMGRVGQTYINVDRTYERTGSGWYIDGISDYTAPFFQVLGKHESFIKRVYEIYNENKTAINGILTDLDTQSELIAASAEMNYVRWPQYMTNTEHFSVSKDNTTYGSDAYAVTYQKTDSLEDYTGNLKEYLTKRLKFFSDNLTVTAPVAGSITGTTTVAVGDGLSLTAGTTADSYQWQSSADGETWTDIAGATAKTYSATALYTMNGLKIRCVAKNVGETINTTRVAKVAPSASTVLPAVTLSVTTGGGHTHSYQAAVTESTCTEKGYTTYTCACGDSYVDSYTDALGHNFVNGKCTRCGVNESESSAKCVGKENVSLTAGKLLFTLGGHDLGEYTFARSGNGWSIQGPDGKYLSFSKNALSYTSTPFAWSYANGSFTSSATTTSGGSTGLGGILGLLFGGRGTSRTTTTTYYLAYTGGKLTVSTSSSGSSASFAVQTENPDHSFGAWAATENDQHSRTCSVCGVTESEDHHFVNHICTECGAKEAHTVPTLCVGEKTVSLMEGELLFTLGGHELGEYTFDRSGNGWSIQAPNGSYLGFVNNAFTYARTPFIWNYANGSFTTSVTTSSGGTGFGGFWFSGFGGRRTTTTTTYYLCYTGGKLTVSTSSNGSNATFKLHVESDSHSFGPDHRCTVCGAYDMTIGSIDVNVSLSQRSSIMPGFGGFFSFFGRGGNTTTTYIATISTKATGTTVKKVEYSTNNGVSWTSGNTVTSNSKIESFLIRVTDGSGVQYDYLFRNGEVMAE